MKWIIDRFEEKIAIIENEITKEKKEVNTSLLPTSIHEGSILLYQNNKYILSEKEEDQKRKEIEERFKKLRNHP
ncbi:MAG: DUF3006 domain-containing protein [Erysipelotrichaceae bacterium]|nr:DUF3006 domain-containing protein [Erysipelotrichaceae bacterium]